MSIETAVLALRGGADRDNETFRDFANQFDGQQAVLTYSFRTEAPDPVYGATFATFTAAQKATIISALNYISSIANVQFVQTDSPDALVKFGQYDVEGTETGFAQSPYWNKVLQQYESGYVWLDKYMDFSAKGDAIHTILHEVGHILGLLHPFDGPYALKGAELNSSAMSYTYTGPANRLGVYDIIALQSIYGAPSARLGANTYKFGQDKYIWDGGGTDTIDASAATAGAFIDLNGGSWNYIKAKSSSLISSGQVYIGKDTIIENVKGTKYSDRIYGNDANNAIWAGKGNNTVDGRGGNDRIYGDIGSDRLIGGAGADALYGSSGRDTLYGGADNDYLKAGADNDYVDGGDGNDRIYGEAGHNKILGQAGDDYITASTGNDTLYGGDGNDYLNAGSGTNYIDGGAGDDRIYSSTGKDKIYGRDGNDYISASAGDNYVDGGNGDDRIVTSSGKDKIYGGAGRDNIATSSGNDTVYGGADDDYISAGSGNNIVDGGDGNDSIYGGSGIDKLVGGNGNDRIIASGGNDKVYGGTGDDYLHGGSGNNYLDGGADNDTIIAEKGNDKLYGGLGNDTLVSGSGTDYLNGSWGFDYLSGGSGNDTLIGGGNADRLSGGSGKDLFVFYSYTDFGDLTEFDRILDFRVGDDKIDFSRVDANPAASGRQKMTFLGNGTDDVRLNSGKAGQFYFNTTSHELVIDANGDGIADHKVGLDGVIAMKGAYFVL